MWFDSTLAIASALLACPYSTIATATRLVLGNPDIDIAANIQLGIGFDLTTSYG